MHEKNGRKKWTTLGMSIEDKTFVNFCIGILIGDKKLDFY